MTAGLDLEFPPLFELARFFTTIHGGWRQELVKERSSNDAFDGSHIDGGVLVADIGFRISFI